MLAYNPPAARASRHGKAARQLRRGLNIKAWHQHHDRRNASANLQPLQCDVATQSKLGWHHGQHGSASSTA